MSAKAAAEKKLADELAAKAKADAETAAKKKAEQDAAAKAKSDAESKKKAEDAKKITPASVSASSLKSSAPPVEEHTYDSQDEGNVITSYTWHVHVTVGLCLFMRLTYAMLLCVV